MVAVFLFFLPSFSFAAQDTTQEAKILKIETAQVSITINAGTSQNVESGMPAFILHEDKKLGPFPIISADKKTAQIRLTDEVIMTISDKDKVLIEWPAWIFARGLRRYNTKDFPGALSDFQNVAKAVFGHEPSHFNMGLVYLEQDKYSEALAAFQSAAKYNPYNLFTQKFIADIFILLKKDSEAEKKLKKLMETNLQDTSFHLKNGLLAIKKNKFDTAVDEFTFVRNLSSQDITSRVNLAGIALIKNDLGKAKEYLAETQLPQQTEEKILGSLYWTIKSRLHRELGEDKQASEAMEHAALLAPEWKILQSSTVPLEKLLIESAGTRLLSLAMSGFTQSAPLEFEQSEVSKHTVEQITKETTSTAPVITKKKPFNLSGEVATTLENYDRNPATSNPINDFNSETNLKINGDEKGVYFKNEFDWYYNRWDHTQLDYFKVNIKDNKNDEVDIGKFSAKNFPNLVSHPSIEQGGRWWHRFERPAYKPPSAAGLPETPEMFSDNTVVDETDIPSLSSIYNQNFIDRRLFKIIEITVLRGRSKEPINLDYRKEKNDRTYETSGQFEQWTNAFHIMTKPTDISEMGFSYSRVKDDELSATVSSTTYAIESEALGMDGKIELLDGKLKVDGEAASGDYDSDLRTYDKNKQDKAYNWGFNYKPVSQWEFDYDAKRIGKNFKVEGAYQTEDKITHTWSTKYSAAKNVPWSIRSFDYKFEPAHTNIQKRGDNTRSYYNTMQPKISFNLPQDAKVSLDYKYYYEMNTCDCTRYQTNTLKTDVEYEYKPLKTTLKPAYTFERKDDLVASPTDEKQKDVSVTLENKWVKNLTETFIWERDMKTYVGATTKSYDNMKYSWETKYAFIPNRFDCKIKASIDNKDQTDTNDIELDTLDFTADYTSKDGNTKVSLEYEHKYNLYRPWSESSAYKQKYFKLKLTRKF
ncbi:MAG: tetratricopeptide repeat protein [Candidatus Omnitrophota bacterium]